MKKRTHIKIIKGMIIFLIPVFIFHAGYLVDRILNNTITWHSLALFFIVTPWVLHSTLDSVESITKKKTAKSIEVISYILNFGAIIFATVMLIWTYLK